MRRGWPRLAPETPETNGALLTALTHNLTSERAGPGEVIGTNSSFVGFLAGPPRIQYDAAVSRDGRIVASGGADDSGRGGLVVVFDTTEREQIGRIAAEQPVVQVDVSDDG